MGFPQQLQACVEQANEALRRFIASQPFRNTPLVEAMYYDAFLGGKRLRLFLIYATGAMFGVNRTMLDAPAAAIEYIHAYSLVHDDLPAVDDNDLRRGLPICHIKFGEVNAVLAGDALQMLAFSVLSDTPTANVSDRDRLAMVSELAQASGVVGMCGGQALGLEAEGQQVDLQALERIHRHKTGALIRVAVRMGALSAGERGRAALLALNRYAENIGLAFQVQDDILDVMGDIVTLGKRQGADQQLGKNTYPALLGLEQARKKTHDLIAGARRSLDELAAWSLDTSVLETLANYVIQCDKQTINESLMSFDIARYPALALVDFTQELRLLPKESLPKLYDGLRHYLLDSVSRSSDHFASGLDMVELTVALHYVYNAPPDRLIWDVGHQAYPHKILTGRRDKIGTIRQKDGLYLPPWRGESEYDVLSADHSSTSISAGIRVTIAVAKEDKQRRVVCVIGDGTIITGMAFEVMNRAGDIKPDLLVALNDNEMSISESVGTLNDHPAQLLSGKLYSVLREGGRKAFPRVPPIKELLKRTEEHIKGMVVPRTLFEELGFNYIGPVDGHDVLGLVSTLKSMCDLEGPQFLHTTTKKGRGYESTEKDPITFHAVPEFDHTSGILPKSSGGLSSYSKIFGDWLCETAAKDSKLMAITPAMREGSSMVEFSKKFPDQYFDVATAEQYTVTFAAGLAIGDYKSVVTIYSTFLQRACDQVIHDVAIQKLLVLFAIDRAGIVGTDNQTHQGAFDLSSLRCISDMVVITPSDEDECRQMLYTGYHYSDGPCAVRYSCGSSTGVTSEPLASLPIGEGMVKRQGEKIVILNFGTLLPEAAAVADKLNVALVGIRFVEPLDTVLILQLAGEHDALVILEENTIMGGAGSGVNEVLTAHRWAVPALNIGPPDYFIPQGTQEEIRADLGLDTAGIEAKIRDWLA